MKKIIAKILLILSLFTLVNITTLQASAEDVNVVKVTEEIPGANCVLEQESGLYRCEVKRWFGSIMQVMWQMLKYFTFIAGLLAVLMIVIWWIMYSMWWADDALKTKSKEFITKAILGLIVLLLSWTILYAVAPWVYK